MSEQKMRDALESLLDHYVGLVNSGDAGCWNPEDEVEVIVAREALAQQPAAVVELTDAHPMQPVVMIGDVARFKANPIVELLLQGGNGWLK